MKKTLFTLAASIIMGIGAHTYAQNTNQDQNTKEKTVETFDYNNDNIVNETKTTHFEDDYKIIKREIDVNDDGKIDIKYTQKYDLNREKVVDRTTILSNEDVLKKHFLTNQNTVITQNNERRVNISYKTGDGTYISFKGPISLLKF